MTSGDESSLDDSHNTPPSPEGLQRIRKYSEMAASPDPLAPPTFLAETREFPPKSAVVGAPEVGINADPGQKSNRNMATFVGVAGALGALIGCLVGATVAWFVLDSEDSDEAVLSTLGASESIDIQAVLNKVQPSVVTIEIDQENLLGVFNGAGSGVIISQDGLVLTNHHVVAGAEEISVQLHGGVSETADLIAANPADDIALIQIRDQVGLVPAELGSSGALNVGDEVIAIGNALNLGGTPSVTLGIVSAQNRAITAQGLTLESLIQTDAAINRGNSGGPLVNSDGQVVGINTAIIEEAQNIGFAIAIDAIQPLIEEMSNGDAEITRDSAFLGIQTVDLDRLDASRRDELEISAETGVVVVEVVVGSAAEEAGLVPGDVLISVDGKEVVEAIEVIEAIQGRDSGDIIDLVLLRGDETIETTADLTSRGAIPD